MDPDRQPDDRDDGHEALDRLAAALARDRRAVALTGAGVSVPSGIPDFRSPDGIWQRYDPLTYAHIDALRDDPARVWQLLWELDELFGDAEPNGAHTALAELEAAGIVTAVVTQNPDGLHHRAGSRTVHEVHGSGRTLSCLSCGRGLPREDLAAERGTVPRCVACGGVLRPDVTFFGETLPSEAIAAAEAACRGCAHLLVVGTSAEVEPVGSLPGTARSAGATVWEINPHPSATVPAHGRVAQAAEGALPQLAARLR